MPVSDDDAKRAEKYVAKHAHEFPGICSDQAKATYILEIARIVFSLEGLVASKPAAPKLIEVQEWRDRGAYDPQGGPPEESYSREHRGEPSSPSGAPHVGFTCVYLYKLAHPIEKVRHPRGDPDYYYCPYGFRFGPPLTEMMRFVSRSTGPQSGLFK
ncbi:MAG: hypothetical protein HY010_13685 [Acidobacteria bacterium]|nr:hypothetical protein [Acidobacteriota bacterium]